MRYALCAFPLVGAVCGLLLWGWTALAGWLPLPGVLPRIHIYYLLFFIYYLLY